MRFSEIINEEFVSDVEGMRQAALAIVDNQTDIPKPLTSEKWETEIVEKLRSWGDVAQNALCPCSSGKRFKHCHGVAG